MAKKSFARMKKRAEEARMKKVMYALETLGAAYCKETDILPTEACLRVKPDEGTGELLYWFEHSGPRINDQTAHPHVQFLVNSVYALIAAKKLKDIKAEEDIVSELERFVEEYENAK